MLLCVVLFGNHLACVRHPQVSSSALELGAISKAVGSSMAQLLTAANQGNESYTGVAARETANSLKVSIEWLFIFTF